MLRAAAEADVGDQFGNQDLAEQPAVRRDAGVLVPTLFDEVFAEILEGAHQVLKRFGYDLIVETSDYDLGFEEAWVERILKWAPAGLILTGSHHRCGLTERIRATAVPVVEVWDAVEEPIDVCVGINHRSAGVMAAEHLLARGYRRPCLVGVSEGRDPRAESRFRGFIDRMDGAGAVGIQRADCKPSFEAGREAVQRLLAGDTTSYDCYFFLNDHLAFGGLCALEAAGIEVPAAVGVMGFNNLGVNQVLNRRITTIETPRKEMGILAGQRLLARIHDAATDTVTILKPILQPGDTTRAADPSQQDAKRYRA